MRNRPRLLNDDDRDALLDLCASRPLENIFVASRAVSFGLDSYGQGCSVLGFERHGTLVAACHVGANLVPVGDDEEAMAAFAHRIGPRRSVVSICGAMDGVHLIFDYLTSCWGASWDRYREFREYQPLMAISTPSPIAPDRRIQPISQADALPYMDAAVAMYTEEVGCSPEDPSGSYRRYIATLIDSQMSFGGISNGQVWFKSDIGTAWGSLGQIQGVWLHPDLRGQGLSEPAMSQVVELGLRRFCVLSLYVNDFNIRARRMYERVGFTEVGAMSTVLY